MVLLERIKTKSNLTKRICLGTIMASSFALIIYGGPLAILATITAVQMKCFSEIIELAYAAKKVPKDEKLRTINCYFMFVANYFYYGELFKLRFGVFAQTMTIIKVLMTYHKFVSFCLYLFGFVWFVLSLTTTPIKRRTKFSLFFWTHFLSLIIVLQSALMANLVFEGLIWCIVPISMVVLNDVWAFMFGKLYGKTPLIELSPNKTMEGYIYGALMTIATGCLLSHVLCHYQYFVCPVSYIETNGGIRIATECEPDYNFTPVNFYGVKTFPFLVHALVLSTYASIVAPFGGFMASGFKRAMKVKDFGDVIPGHGGMMDRNDCQYLMATFINVYLYTFVKTDVEHLYKRILHLNDDHQLEFYHLMEEHLKQIKLL